MITSYSVDNDMRFRNALARASKSLSSFKVPFTMILNDFYKSQQAIFKLKGPGQYPPISERYGRAKEKAVGFRYPLLVRTGALAASTLGPNNPGSIAEIGDTELKWGTAIPYGVYHQSDAPRKKMPLRKVLFIGPEATQFATSEQVGRLDRWLKYLNSYVQLQVKKEFS